MKKSLLGLLLAVAMVAPVFAVDKGTMEVDAKLGLIIEPLLMENETDSDKYGYNTDTTFSLGADFYYYAMNNLAVGLGVNHIFKAKINKGWGGSGDEEISSTNVYATVKPILAENGFVDKAYFIGQIGYAVMDNNYIPSSDHSKSLSNGLYWGVGFGVEKYNVILELVYSVSYHKLDYDDWGGEIWTYRNLAVNVGYKFTL